MYTSKYFSYSSVSGLYYVPLVYLSLHPYDCVGKNTWFSCLGHFIDNPSPMPQTHLIQNCLGVLAHLFSHRTWVLVVRASYLLLYFHLCLREGWQQLPCSCPKTCLHLFRICFMSCTFKKKLFGVADTLLNLFVGIYLAINGIFFLLFLLTRLFSWQ